MAALVTLGVVCVVGLGVAVWCALAVSGQCGEDQEHWTAEGRGELRS